jgi:hypothetical protein
MFSIKKYIAQILILVLFIDVLMILDLFVFHIADRNLFVFIILGLIWAGQFIVGVFVLPFQLQYFTPQEKNKRLLCIFFIFYNLLFYGITISIGSGDLKLPWKN